MAEGNPPGSPAPDSLETEFDLREGILVLAAWWREIVGLAVVAMVLGTAFYIITLEYETAADVVVLRARTGVVFDDERFTTLEGRQPAAELLAGRDTLFGLASSGAVALAVSEHLNEEASGIQWQPAALMESVDAELVGVRGARNTRGQASAMVRITARADSPEHAALIANAWAEAYVDLVNTLYAPNSAEQLGSITGELAAAQDAYDAAQRDLEEFVSSNEARRVEQEINARVAVLEGYFDSAIRSLNENRATRRRVRRLLAAAQSLGDHIDAGGAAGLVSNGLAIQLLKVEAYVTAAKVTPPLAPLPVAALLENAGRNDSGIFDNLTSLMLDFNEFSDSLDLTLDFGNFSETHTDAAAQQADVEALDHALQSWLGRLDLAIARLSTDLLSSGFYRNLSVTPGEPGVPVTEGSAEFDGIDGHYADIRTLEARLEALNKQGDQLTSQRDRLFTALDVLRNKEAEFRLAAAVTQPELRLASPAVQPLALPAVGRHLLSPASIFAVAGLLMGVVLAFVGNLLGRGPFLSRDAHSG